MTRITNNWISDLFDGDEVVAYLHVLLPSPENSISRMLDNLDVHEETFLKDIVHYVMYPDDSPFIKTVMEVPSHVFVDGPDQTEQLRGLAYTIKNWYDGVDFSELEAIVSELMAEAISVNVALDVVSAKMKQSYLIVEFSLTREGDV